jgi:DNA-binding transcriptional MerR regulator
MKERLLRQIEEIGEFTLKELVFYSNQLIPLFAAKQRRYKVSEFVNERIVRYYINELLIGKPAYRKGRYAIFTCSHILQILVVKHLQSTYIPLKKISEITKTLKYDDLKAILLDCAKLNLYLSEISPDRKGTFESQVQGPEPGVAASYESPFPPCDRSSTSWRRFQIYDKLELNVEEHFNILAQGVDIKNIFSRIMQVLSSTGQQYRQHEAPDIGDVNFDDLDLGYISPALPLKDRSHAVIALVTEGGLVPKGNPDKLEPARASRFLRYSLQGIDDLRPGEFESVDRGWDNVHVNNDPDRLLPLDIMRELEKRKVYLRLYPYYYTTTGAGTSIDNAKKMGKKIARQLKARGVSGVLFTST